MIVLIIGIMAAIAVPMIGDNNPTRLRAAAQIVAADLAYAQVESVSHGDDTRVVVFDTTNHAYHIAAASDTATPLTNPVGNLPYVLTFGVARASQATGVTIQSLSVGGDDELGFGVYGQLDQTTDATITLACGGHTITITLDATNGESTIGAIVSP